jgi:hypothetical protein
MSDFFSLVQKLHAIEANEKPTTVNESATFLKQKKTK